MMVNYWAAIGGLFTAAIAFCMGYIVGQAVADWDHKKD